MEEEVDEEEGKEEEKRGTAEEAKEEENKRGTAEE